MCCSQNYTYPAVARVKRNLLEKVLFKFKLEVPKVDWSKQLGTKDVGASFGVYFENGIDVLFSTYIFRFTLVFFNIYC